MKSLRRLALLVQGQVQGVGFRPFVWRLAADELLTGFVANTSAGVQIEIQGEQANVDKFCKRLLGELPPLAQITCLDKKYLPLAKMEDAFEIRASMGKSSQSVLVAPDTGICDDCLNDIRDAENPRYNYAFTNCTNCGPRYSIAANIPYDRAATTMACFPMCDKCAAEYGDPANRRFHAQPIACPICGPQLWLVDKEQLKRGRTTLDSVNSHNVIARIGQLLLAGKIAAIRGLGGFQLACNARDYAAVAELRRRKKRPHKALAIMARNLEEASAFCAIGDKEKELLLSAARPIVLCPVNAAATAPLADNIAPDAATIGVMLPTTPLHALLLDWLHNNGMNGPALVMTSANPSGQPICLANREALERLDHLADVWLLHNRDILCRVDDSVIAPGPEDAIFYRRSRGYAPASIDLHDNGPCVLGAGAMLKATFCLTRLDRAFLSQHIGDLDSPATLEFYEQTLAHLQGLLNVRPQAVAHDLHPNFLSTQFARELAAKLQIPAIGLQHHVAHAVACLADNGYMQKALALCLDGTGLGSDGSIWGGELLSLQLENPDWRRAGSMESFWLPGGEAAIREPWRIAAAFAARLDLPFHAPDRPVHIVQEMLQRNINIVSTSSCGRFFDAISSLLGICHEITYEGQAAIKLEKMATQWLANGGKMPSITFDCANCDSVPATAIFRQVHELVQNGMETGAIAAWFHDITARRFVHLADRAAQAENISCLALSGGVLQNCLLQERLLHYISKTGLKPLLHHNTPPGDGCIALGQAVWGRRLLLAGGLLK